MVFLNLYPSRSFLKHIRQKPIVVGFWVRFLSDVLDVLIIGAIGYFLFFAFKDHFYELGESGWWIGLIIAFIYTGLLQSAFGKGQSLAKKLFGIQVIKLDGTFMSIKESWMRYSMIAFIAYHGWVGEGLLTSFPVLNFPVFTLLFGIFFIFCVCSVFLVVPFHPLKRGLHDLLCNTVVVWKNAFSHERLEEMTRLNRSHGPLWASAAAFLAIVGVLGFHWNPEGDLLPFGPQQFEMRQAIERSTHFQNVKVALHVGDPLENHTIQAAVISAFLPMSKYHDAAFLKEEIQKASDEVIRHFPQGQPIPRIYVMTRSGFNIGIATLYTNYTMRISPHPKTTPEKIGPFTLDI